MLTSLATVLAGLIGVAVLLIGARALWQPRAADGFGTPKTPVDDPTFRAWLKVKAVRDIACGLFVLVLVAGSTPQLLGLFMLIAAGIPLGDALIVRHSKGPTGAVVGIHGAAAGATLVSSVLLLAA